MSERLWMIASGILMVLAGFFVWRNNLSALSLLVRWALAPGSSVIASN
jgi:hypothetical protein